MGEETVNRYSVTIKMDHDELTAFLANGVAGKVQIEILPGEQADVVHQLHPAPKPRATRGSKVNDAILGALAEGTRTIKELKAALEKAGLSAGSISTGLAVLQKANRIERTTDGSYALAVQRAAE
jgi:hypothetical protein